MTIKIDQKIVAYSVVNPDAAPHQPAQMNERLARPESLPGCTYKVKTPLSDHALYITINDIVINPGTPDEVRRPFEMFINSKAMEHFQWIVALTRVVSAVFRHGGEVNFLIEELRSVFDPKGGYFKRGGKYTPSLVAEIGDVLEQHLTTLGLFQRDESLAQAAVAMVAEKQAKAEPDAEATGFPDTAELCLHCGTKAAVLMDGCLTCLSCGASKCN